jgi:hypothetical protein
LRGRKRREGRRKKREVEEAADQSDRGGVNGNE